MSKAIERPALLELFLAKKKRFEVYFYTSNLAKYLQGRIVFERFGLVLKHFRSKSDPYQEDPQHSTKELLERAVKEILTFVGTASLFFVEDTSVRIEALSGQNRDYPGLAVKDWFGSTSFEELDLELKERGGERTAIVKSDIALHVPGLSRPVFFHGRTRGKVAESPPNFEEFAEYPWLTSNSFNGWFVPEGSAKRLGEMSFEESWPYDFRVKALVKMIDRLEEFAAVLNLPPQAYTREHRRSREPGPYLFSSENPVLIVVGRTCAGKTTFGEQAYSHHGLRHIEASSIVRMLQRNSKKQDVDAFAFAKEMLDTYGYDIIARRILQLYATDLDKGAVITGFRTIEELEVIKDHFPHAELILLKASERTRFQRNLRRKRIESATILERFKEIDTQQWIFGLLRVAQDFANFRIENEGTLEEYHKQIDVIVSGTNKTNLRGITTDVRPRYEISRNQLYRCLHALVQESRPLTCQEVEEITAESGRRIRHNNANQALKKVPELARRLELDRYKIRYEITSAGRAYIRLMDKINSGLSDPKTKQHN